jgi:hypothetical protein
MSLLREKTTFSPQKRGGSNMHSHNMVSRAAVCMVGVAMVLWFGSSEAVAELHQDERVVVADSVEWCQTMIDFARRHPEMLVARDGACPIQGDCDIAAIRDAWIPDPGTPIVTMPLKINVFCADDGSIPTATQEEVNQQISWVNSEYLPSRIQFGYETEFINSTEYRYLESAEIDAMKTAYADQPWRMLNVYVTYVIGGYSFGTFPWDPDALGVHGGIVMHQNHFGPGLSVMTHELGHNLGLWHTHHGVSETPPGDPCDWPCYEFAESDSDTSGDYTSETDPTPVNYTCVPPGGNDTCQTPNVPWGPTQPENYMSYGGPGCWNVFTGQQEGRIHCWSADRLGSWMIICGDSNDDGILDVADVVYLISYLFVDGPEPVPVVCSGNANGDGIVDIADVVYLINYLFVEGPPPVDVCCAG